MDTQLKQFDVVMTMVAFDRIANRLVARSGYRGWTGMEKTQHAAALNGLAEVALSLGSYEDAISNLIECTLDVTQMRRLRVRLKAAQHRLKLRPQKFNWTSRSGIPDLAEDTEEEDGVLHIPNLTKLHGNLSQS